MDELWKDVKGCEGYYQVSNLGRVKSLPRCVRTSTGFIRFYKGKLFRGSVSTNGYLQITLSKGTGKMHTVHYLVALHFVPGFAESLQVNHIDENKLNNNADNLEWVTASYNMGYGLGAKLRGACAGKTRSKPINQLSKSGDFIKSWLSAHEIERELGYSNGYINQTCLGKKRMAYGFIWKFALGQEKGEN